MVGDLGRSLGKQVRLEIVGATTQVDGGIPELLDAPLGHLPGNAVDHSIESPRYACCTSQVSESRSRSGRGTAGV
jgi:two-component system sensor histidine kinase and response regulator WspE